MVKIGRMSLESFLERKKDNEVKSKESLEAK